MMPASGWRKSVSSYFEFFGQGKDIEIFELVFELLLSDGKVFPRFKLRVVVRMSALVQKVSTLGQVGASQLVVSLRFRHPVS